MSQEIRTATYFNTGM